MIKLEKTLYTASATAFAGRDGRVKTDDGTLDLSVVPPKSLGGSGAPGTNPEQLFAAGYAACFGSAVGVVARRLKLQPGPVQVTAKVHLGPAGQSYGLAVELSVNMPELQRERAEEVIRAAHEVCPYSNATRGNIDVQVKLA